MISKTVPQMELLFPGLFSSSGLWRAAALKDHETSALCCTNEHYTPGLFFRDVRDVPTSSETPEGWREPTLWNDLLGDTTRSPLA